MDYESEMWRDIKNYEGLYQISSFGRVKSLEKYVKSPLKNQNKVLRKEKILKQCIRSKYLCVGLSKEGKTKTFLIHRLVAIAFLPNPEGKREVNHKNGNKIDNSVENLEWCTSSENQLHAYKNKLQVITEKQREISRLNGKRLSMKVNQYDINKNFIQKWNGISEAGRQLKIDPTNISYCCKGKRKTAGGFKWEYAREG